MRWLQRDGERRPMSGRARCGDRPAVRLDDRFRCRNAMDLMDTL
jgi:hypothetical protein